MSACKSCGAEVERLRAENRKLNAGLTLRATQNELAGRRAELAMANEEVTTLREETRKKEREIEKLLEEFGHAQGVVANLNKEAQTARLALDVADKEVAALRAKLKWFEEEERFITETFIRREVLGSSELVAWQRENPKPGAAT